MNIDENRIREFAHQIWQSEGCPDGQAHRHWEMACRLAAADETANYSEHSQQKMPDAPQHKTVKNNDMDIINQPKKTKAKALKKTIAADSDGVKDTSVDRMAPSDLNSAAPAMSKKKGKKTTDELAEPHSAPHPVSFAKDGGQKSSRRKKAQVLNDVINTEMPDI